MIHVFISYKREEQAIAEQVYQWLAGHGYRPWMDVHNIPAGAESWADEIEKGLQNADVVLGLMSRRSIASVNVKNEWDYTIVNGKKHATRLVLVKLDDCDVPLNYIRYNYIDWRKPDPFSHIQRALDHPAPDPADPTTAEEQAYLEWLYQTLNRILAAKIIFSDPTNPDPIRLYSDRARGAVDALFEKTAEFNPMYDAFGLDDLQEIPASEYADFANAIKDFNGRLLLLGEPGAGKSITLLHEARVAVVQRLVDKRVPLPVFGNIAFWNAYDHDSWLPWLKSVTVNMLSDVADWLKRGDLIIFADGLDELGSTKPSDPTHPDGETFDPRLRFMEQLPPDNRVLVSCRVKDYAAIGAKIKLKGAVTLRPLSLAQITDFLRKMPPLLEAIQRDSRLREMVETPLLLSLFAAGYRDSDEDDLRELADLAASPGDLRDKIFERYVHDRYRHEANKYRLRREAVPYTLEEVYDRLGYVAVLNAVGGWGVEDNVLDDDYNGALDADFAAFALQLDLVRPLPDKEGLGFVHLRLRDYMAYTWGLMPPDNARLLTERELDTRLLILRMLERVPDERAVPALMEALNGRDRWVRRGVIRTLGQIGGAVALETLVMLLTDNDPVMRRGAALALGQIGDSSVIPDLLNALQDPDDGVRSGVALALRQVHEEGAYESLLRMLHGDNSLAQRYALDLLQQWGWLPTTLDEKLIFYTAQQDWEALATLGADVLPTLLAQLNQPQVSIRRGVMAVLMPYAEHIPSEIFVHHLQDPDATVRLAAAQMLTQHNWQPQTDEEQIYFWVAAQDWLPLKRMGPVCLPVLLERIKEPDTAVKMGILEILGHYADPATLPVIIKTFNENNKKVRQAALNALSEFGNKAPLDGLVLALHDNDQTIRKKVLGLLELRSWKPTTLEEKIAYYQAREDWNALSQMGEQAAPALIAAIGDNKVDVPKALLKAFRDLNPMPTIPLLKATFDRSTQNKRRAIVKVLAAIGNEQAYDTLLDVLNDKDPIVQRTVIEAIAQFNTPTTLQILMDALGHPHKRVRASAVQGLGNLREPSVVPALVAALSDSAGMVRLEAVTALTAIGDSAALPNLKAALQDVDPKVVKAAWAAIKRLEATQAIVNSREALEDPDPANRHEAIETLKQVDDVQTTDMLIAALADPDSWVRNNAVWALGEGRDSDAIPALIQALRDDDSGVRYSAGQALKLIDTNAAIPALIEVFKEQDWRIRRDSAKTLIQLGEEALPALVEALSHRNTRVRANAAEVLGQIGNPSVVPALVEALRDKAKHGNGGRVCDSAATALEQIGTEEALEAVAAWEQTPIGKQRRP